MIITDLDAEEIRIYTGLNEKQVKKIYEPETGAFICESLRVIERALDAGYEPISFFIEETMLDEAGSIIPDDVPVYTASHNIMKEITGYSLTGGVLSAMRRKTLKSPEHFADEHHNIVVLNDIENPTNVGAIFRSAAALGADGILLTDGSADPLYRRAARVSMGSVFSIDWTFASADFVADLSSKGFITFALALSDKAEPLGSLSYDTFHKKAVILGNEDHGISQSILDHCDHTVMITMYNGIDSLNVAAASAVACWELFKLD